MISLPALRLTACLLLPVVTAAAGYAAGHAQSERYWQAALQARVGALQTARAIEIQRQQADALASQQAWRQRVDQLESRVLVQQQTLQQWQNQQARRIDDATRHDGDRFTGLGPDSLRLYRQLLGYSAELPGAQPLSAGAAAEAAGADAGLPAPDLLAHAADYGAWCQQLEQRLVALKQLYPAQEPTP
ncbi:hypothetical protein CXB49_21510 [Chromobacterium sp. ATCC 53434]|uniref:hypothetical protein n=1 Tax=Chromobacterium sp. (strain ATCC 53434 / SC 14030) TaxID=2059672 RepID=UPI000C758713|nr:hypothetical protein [Chromobacterium sp. ATCC 53434]AUH53184.1 hypothetical protein CXB49_21510 [Chromobacterium sp. ATCC 53434]